MIEFGLGCKKSLVFLTQQLRAFIDLAFVFIIIYDLSLNFLLSFMSFSYI